MTEEIKYYTGNCITDLHTDTSISYCNEEKCKQYIKSDGLKFCMSSVCPEKDCIYALVNKLHQTINRLEQENKELKDKITALEDKLQLRMASDKESDEYWDEIFSAEDYPFNKENAYKELKDYYFVLEQIPKIYMEITGGTLSKTTYFASSVIQAYNDALERYYDKIDDLEYNNNAYRSALEEINRVVKLAHKVEDYLLGQDYTDLVDRIENKINEVLQ